MLKIIKNKEKKNTISYKQSYNLNKTRSLQK